MAIRISAVPMHGNQPISAITPLPSNYVPTSAAAAALMRRVSYQNGVKVQEAQRNALNGLGELVQVVT